MDKLSGTLYAGHNRAFALPLLEKGKRPHDSNATRGKITFFPRPLLEKGKKTHNNNAEKAASFLKGQASA